MLYEHRMNKLAKNIAVSIMEEQALLNELADNSDSKNNSDDQKSNFITLTDADGNEVILEILDLISYQGQKYAVLLPVDDADDDVIILELKEDADATEHYLSIHDEGILSAVFNVFKEKNRHRFNFGD